MAGLCPEPQGELKCSPDPLAAMMGLLLRGREGGKEGDGREERGRRERQGMEWKEEEGGGKEKGDRREGEGNAGEAKEREVRACLGSTKNSDYGPACIIIKIRN